MPQIEVTFAIDANGIVSVSACDKMTGHEQAMKITPSSGLSASEIYDLIEEGIRNTEQDRRMKEIIIARNRLEGLLQNTIRSFSEFGYMLSGNDQERARQAIDEAREAALSDSPDRIRTALEHLENIARLITNGDVPPDQHGARPRRQGRRSGMPLSELS